MIETETSASTAASMPPELQSPRAKLVYLYLSSNDGATVERTAESLGMTKLSLYSVLRTLREGGLVEGDDAGYRVV